MIEEEDDFDYELNRHRLAQDKEWRAASYFYEQRRPIREMHQLMESLIIGAGVIFLLQVASVLLKRVKI
jgi:hypothetical protein